VGNCTRDPLDINAEYDCVLRKTVGAGWSENGGGGGMRPWPSWSETGHRLRPSIRDQILELVRSRGGVVEAGRLHPASRDSLALPASSARRLLFSIADRPRASRFRRPWWCSFGRSDNPPFWREREGGSMDKAPRATQDQRGSRPANIKEVDLVTRWAELRPVLSQSDRV